VANLTPEMITNVYLYGQSKLNPWPGERQNDLVINIDGVNGGSRGQVTLVGQFDHSAVARDKGVSKIALSDGVVWTDADLTFARSLREVRSS
jgi:hypothetical protein